MWIDIMNMIKNYVEHNPNLLHNPILTFVLVVIVALSSVLSLISKLTQSMRHTKSEPTRKVKVIVNIDGQKMELQDVDLADVEKIKNLLSEIRLNSGRTPLTGD